MKKSILCAAAVAALAMGGVAQADVIDSVGNTISQIFGVPYDSSRSGSVPMVNGVYTDSYGRHFQQDAYGRLVPLGQYGSYRDQWGRTVYLGANNQPMYTEQNGQVVPYSGDSYAAGRSYDRDRDGISNRYDRYPDDPRYR